MSNLEPVLGGDDTVRRNFSKIEDLYTQLTAATDRITTLEALVTALLAGKKIRSGSGTLTFTASSASAVLNVAHGLGVTPTAVVAMTKTPANVRTTIQETAAADATNFQVAGFTTDGSIPTTTQNFYWLAIG